LLTSAIEIGLGITTASLATLRPLVRRAAEAIRSYRSRSYGYTDERSRTTPVDKTSQSNKSQQSDWDGRNVLLSATNQETFYNEKDTLDESPSLAPKVAPPQKARRHASKDDVRLLPMGLSTTGSTAASPWNQDTGDSFSPFATRLYDEESAERLPAPAPTQHSLHPVQQQPKYNESVLSGVGSDASGIPAWPPAEQSQKLGGKGNRAPRDENDDGPIELPNGFRKWVIKR
jgi:hypothetical protein